MKSLPRQPNKPYLCALDYLYTGGQWRRHPWGTGVRAPWSLRMHTNFAAVQTMAVLIFLPSSVSSKLDRQNHQLLWQTVAKNFSHIRFCRPNAKWLSLLDDFVTTNFRTHAPRARATLEQNSGNATAGGLCAAYKLATENYKGRYC